MTSVYSPSWAVSDSASAALPPGERGDPPVRGVRRLIGVPGLVGAEEVAEPEMHEPDRRRCPAATRDARQSLAAHSLNARVGRSRHEIDGDLDRLVLVEPVLGDQLGQHPGVDAARHVVPGRDRAERARVVDEAGRAGEARGLGHRGAEAPDRLGRVEEPPRRADVDRRIEAGQRRELAREDRLVEREQDEVEVRVGAEALEQRAQRVGELDPERDVMAGVRPEAPPRSARGGRGAPPGAGS